MDGIELEKVEWKNFGSWKDGSLRLNNRGLVLVRGLTGVGKSTAFRALYWGLFGITPERSKADEVVNDTVRGNTCVSVTYRRGRVRYRVNRYRNHDKNGNKAILYRNNVKWNEADSINNVVDRHIQATFGYAPDAFSKTLYFVQRDFRSRFPSLTDAHQKNLLEEVTEISIIPRAESIAKDRLRDAERIVAAINVEIKTLESEAASHKEALHEAKAQQSINTKAIKHELKALKVSLEDTKDQLKAASDEYDKVNTLRNEALSSVNKYEEKVAAISATIRVYEKQLTQLSNVSDKCPTCGSEVTQDHLEEEKKNISDKLISLKHKRAAQTLKLDAAEKDVEAINIGNVMKQKSLLEKKVVNLKHEIRLVEQKIKISDINLDYHLDAIKKINRKIDARKSRLQLATKWKLQAEFWVRGFGSRGLRALILPLILDELAKRSNHYLSVIFHKKPLSVKYSLTKSARIEQSYNRGKSWRSYASLSGGEKQAADLCAGLALRDIAESASASYLDLIILDEAFEGLDKEIIKRVPNLLKALNKRSIFVISHEEGLIPYFPSVLTVEQKDGFSTWSN